METKDLIKYIEGATGKRVGNVMLSKYIARGIITPHEQVGRTNLFTIEEADKLVRYLKAYTRKEVAYKMTMRLGCKISTASIKKLCDDDDVELVGSGMRPRIPRDQLETIEKHLRLKAANVIPSYKATAIIKECMRRGITQTTIANACDVDGSYISKILNGTRNMNRKQYTSIEKLLNENEQENSE
jgi:hypothetical protein